MDDGTVPVAFGQERIDRYVSCVNDDNTAVTLHIKEGDCCSDRDLTTIPPQKKRMSKQYNGIATCSGTVCVVRTHCSACSCVGNAPNHRAVDDSSRCRDLVEQTKST